MWSWDGKSRGDRHKLVLTKGMEVVWKVWKKEVEGWFLLTALHLILHWHISEEDKGTLSKADICRCRVQATNVCRYGRSGIFCLEDLFSNIAKCCIWGSALVMQDSSAERWVLELAGNEVHLGAWKTTTTPHFFFLLICLFKSGRNNKVWWFAVFLFFWWPKRALDTATVQWNYCACQNHCC